ncbi:MAG: YkgJ family cysteine cluster protein [Taibaiella sp.]|nr:YkgJ family cysteine cluster protein [Taibaiella sp.]
MDLVKFKARSKAKRAPLTEFLAKFDIVVPPDMDAIASKANEEVWKEIDCTTCANCCKTMSPTFSPKDIKRIAAHLQMKPNEFKEKYLYKEEETGDWMNKQQPCQFLENNMCTIYDVRPDDCAGFPHHHLKPFDMYNDMYRDNLKHCPATLLLVEKVKAAVERKWDMNG